MSRRIAGCLLVVVLGTAAPAGNGEAEPSEPVKSELVEKAASRLAQVFVTVSGPPETVTSLAPDDLSVKVNVKTIEQFQLDRYCRLAGPTPSPPSPAAEDDPPPEAPALSVTYLFYFDQPHLTLAGRQRSLDVARDLIRKLIKNGDRGMLVSNANRLAVIEELTADPARLLAAVERLEHDRTQWDFFANEEESRVARLVEVLNKDNDLPRAIATARSFQREERWITDKNVRRLALTLARLADLSPPKAVIYFADNLRSNAGEHYLSFFGDVLRERYNSLNEMATDSQMGQLPFDKLINEASTQGIRFYTVKAEGLVTTFQRELPNPSALTLTRTVSASSRVRHRDVKNTLANLASETGGHSFPNGAASRKIAAKIVEDFDCMYLVSFDPTGLPLDAPLRVVIESRRKDVSLRTRGRIFLQSDEARLSSRLLSAFALNKEDSTGIDLRTHLVPTGFSNGSYSALLQVSVPPTALPTASWDMGASMIFRDKVREEISGSLVVTQPGVPLVLEHEVRVRPGPHEIVAVAHEAGSDFILSDHVRFAWPDPDAQRAVCAPITLLQPAAGAFVRDGNKRTSGSLARSKPDPVITDRPTALMGLICRGRRQKGPLSVERGLRGRTELDFPPLQVELTDERCAQVRDLIPAGSLPPGDYRYVVRIRQGETLLHESSRGFSVIDPG